MDSSMRNSNGKVKVNVAESITSGSSGTTSASGLCGLVLVAVGIISFLVLLGFYFFNIGEAVNIKNFMDIDIIIISVGSTLIGGRKLIGMLGNNRNANVVQAVSDAMEEYKREEEKSRNRERHYGDSTYSSGNDGNLTNENLDA